MRAVVTRGGFGEVKVRYGLPELVTVVDDVSYRWSRAMLRCERRRREMLAKSALYRSTFGEHPAVARLPATRLRPQC